MGKVSAGECLESQALSRETALWDVVSGVCAKLGWVLGDLSFTA